MPVHYSYKKSPYEPPRARSNLKVNKNRLSSNNIGSTCRSDACSYSESSSSFQSSDIGTSFTAPKRESSFENDANVLKEVDAMESHKLLFLQLERLQKNRSRAHSSGSDVVLWTRSSMTLPRTLSSKTIVNSVEGRRPSTVPFGKTSEGESEIFHLEKLQGGGQVKWKPPAERKRPHQHPSSIQLPAVYETWKEPSRVNRRRTQAAAAAAAEARRSTRSVPTLSRRDRTDSPEERVSTSAPSSKPLPSKHDRLASDSMSSSKKSITPPRLPKINTLFSGGPESNSSVDSPTRKQKHNKKKDVEKKTIQQSSTSKTISSPSPSDERANEVATQAKGERLKSRDENNNVTKGNESTHSKKLQSDALPQIQKKDSEHESIQKEGPSERLKDSNTTVADGKQTEKLRNNGTSESASKVTNDYQRTNAIKDQSYLKTNASEQSEKVLNKLPKRSTDRGAPEIKRDDKKHKNVAETKGSKSELSSKETRVMRSLAKANTQPALLKQRLNDVDTPTKTPPSRLTNRIGTTSSSRVNPRAKSDLVKPPMQRRRTKTGFFTASGEFATNDDDGKHSDISAATSSKKTEATTSTRRSNISNSTTSTKSSSKTTASTGTTRKPLKRRPFIITKKTLSRQKFYNSVYNNQHFKIQRQTAFLKKVENAQVKIDDEKLRESRNSQAKQHRSVVRQYQELKRIRDKFDEEQVKRFSRQYVSWRSVEEDRLKRQSTQYGLPDNIYEDRYDKTLKEIPKVKRAKSKTNPKPEGKKFNRFARWVRNIRRFELILKPNMGAGLEESMLRSTKGALVEGRDIVELHQSQDDGGNGGGNGSAKTMKMVKVRSVIGSAKRLLQATQDMDAISEVSGEDDDNDDDDDNFSDISSLDISDDEK